MSKNDNSPYVTVDEKQVFTANFMFQQMQALDARIDKVKNIALTSIIISVISTIAIILLALLC